MGFTPTTPHSAAGWRIEPPVSEPSASGAKPAATAAALPPRRAAGHPASVSCGLRVGPKAEFSVDEPMANSSRLVLPIDDGAGGGEPLDDGGVVGRPPALEDLRRAGRGDAPGAEVVLEGDRHAGQRARVVARRRPCASTASAAARASSASTRLKAWISPSRASMRGEVLARRTSSGRALAGADGGGDARARRRVTAPRPRIGGHPEAAVLGRRGLRPAPRRGRGTAPTTSARSTLASGYGWVIGLDAVEVEGVDVGGVVEHGGELAGVALELVVGELEAGEPGDVGDVAGGDAVGHDRSC